MCDFIVKLSSSAIFHSLNGLCILQSFNFLQRLMYECIAFYFLDFLSNYTFIKDGNLKMQIVDIVEIL